MDVYKMDWDIGKPDYNLTMNLLQLLFLFVFSHNIIAISPYGFVQNKKKVQLRFTLGGWTRPPYKMVSEVGHLGHSTYPELSTATRMSIWNN